MLTSGCADDAAGGSVPKGPGGVVPGFPTNHVVSHSSSSIQYPGGTCASSARTAAPGTRRHKAARNMAINSIRPFMVRPFQAEVIRRGIFRRRLRPWRAQLASFTAGTRPRSLIANVVKTPDPSKIASPATRPDLLLLPVAEGRAQGSMDWRCTSAWRSRTTLSSHQRFSFLLSVA